MLDLLLDYTEAEGDFKWGVAHHPYPQSLFEPKAWLDTEATFDYNTPLITFKNLEVLDAWIKQPRALYKGKEKRTLYLSEQNPNSKDYSEEALLEQAAGMAYALKKLEACDGIDAYQMHGWFDQRGEGGLRIGIRRFPDDKDDPSGRKPAWFVFQAFGTDREEEAFEFAKKIIGIDSWDRILQGEAPQHHDLKQAEAMIENFSARNLTGLQIVPYTEPDGRPVRRMVGPVVAPDDGRNCGGLEIIELEHPFAPEDEVLAQRLLELLQHYLVHAAPTAWRAAPEERFLQELLFCEPAQQSAMQKKLHRFPALEAPPHFYLASIPLSQAHRLTRTNQQALLAHEWPEGWFMQTETAFLLLLPGTGDAAQPEQLLQKLQEVGLRMDQTVILSMPFPSLLQLGTVWRFNQEAAATARDLHCGAGCRSASALYQDVFVRTIAQSANLRAFIHPMLRRLQEYDQAHSTALLHTLCVYLLQEQNLHATARQLFIHRNTLVYRLQRIRTLLQLDLDDAAVRNVLRTGCILLEYYQGAF